MSITKKEKSVDELVKAKQKLAESTRALNEVKAITADKEVVLDELNKDVADSSSENDKLVLENNKLNATIDESRETLSKITKDVEKILRDKSIEEGKINDGITAKESEARAELKKIEDKKTEMTESYDFLLNEYKEKIAEEDKKRAKAKDNTADIINKIGMLTREKEEAQQKYKEISDTNSVLLDENKRVADDNKALHDITIGLKEEEANLVDFMESGLKQKKDLIDSNKKLAEEINSNVVKLEEIKKEYAKVETDKFAIAEDKENVFVAAKGVEVAYKKAGVTIPAEITKIINRA